MPSILEQESGDETRIQVLGAMRISGPGGVSEIPADRIGSLFGFLALRPDVSHSRDQVCAAIWPEVDGDTSRERLRMTLSRLRNRLESACPGMSHLLFADRHVIRLQLAPGAVDAEAFRQLVRAADKERDLRARVEALSRAVSLYQGELLPGLYDDWVEEARRELEADFAVVREDLIRCCRNLGDLEGAVQHAKKLISVDPLNEDAHCVVMRMLIDSGRPAEAIRQFAELESLLQKELGLRPCEAAQQLKREAQDPRTRGQSTPEKPAGILADFREPLGGAVPLSSPYYVERPTDEAFRVAVANRESIVLIKGPREVGKTSLLARGCVAVRRNGAVTARTDLQKLAPEQLMDARSFYTACWLSIADQIGADQSPEEGWDTRRSANDNFERFLRRRLMANSDLHVVWAIDEADRLFGTSFHSQVFGLFRSWHNERAFDPDSPWQRLTLAIAYATEAHLFITDLNQSPFNVGRRIALEDFTLKEAAELNARYGEPIRDPAGVRKLVEFVGGSPLLLQKSIAAIRSRSLTLDELEGEALREGGLFHDHLRRLMMSIRSDESLRTATIEVLSTGACPDSDSYFRLRSAGVLAAGSPGEARLRCRLYEDYLRSVLL